ncbi:MAG: helix-turn-helix domain-containing protein [Microbacterium sp.]|uniref:winged helix-turn-helix transcriptional regulator n=1 Tax=Microbacterium sp. TaxID=51671 RepID=UPI002722D801|nr:helix-turn-helix domain-containing protein [Microbacterium sp.]MDO8383850.1 helix-turn-helix domain-containing protein [Microbacterium sp.]
MVKRYSADPCPFGPVAEILLPRWTSQILWVLSEHGTLRFTRFRELIPGITPKVLTERLRTLERDGLVVRAYHAELPPRVEYTATALAQTLSPTFRALAAWADEHLDEVGFARQRFDAPGKSALAAQRGGL